MLSPAALSIILTTFAEGPERNRALSVWGAIAGAGGAVGLLLGGLLVQALSWRWVFFVNVPIGAVVLALAPRIVPESQATAVAKGGFDLQGAGTITLGTMALVFTLIKADSWGWTSGRTIVGFVVAAVGQRLGAGHRRLGTARDAGPRSLGGRIVRRASDHQRGRARVASPRHSGRVADRRRGHPAARRVHARRYLARGAGRPRQDRRCRPLPR